MWRALGDLRKVAPSNSQGLRPDPARHARNFPSSPLVDTWLLRPLPSNVLKPMSAYWYRAGGWQYSPPTTSTRAPEPKC